jgi:hypothetical protein
VASRHVVLFGIAAALVLGSSRANAEPSLTDRATARALMDEGDRDVAQKDLTAALKAYRGADAIMHVPTTAIEVARTEEQLGLLLEAYETAYAILRAPPLPHEPAAFAASRTAATALVANLGGRIPSLEVRLPGLLAGVRPSLTVDGEPVPPETIALPRRVNPGKHAVVVSAPGYARATREVTVSEREKAAVEVRLQAAPAVGGGVVAPGPVTAPIAAAAATAPPQARARHSMALTYTMLAVGGAGVVAGAVTGFMSLSSVSSASCNSKNVCTAPGASGDLSTGKSLAWASDVTFGIGIIGVAAATVLYFTRPSDAPAPSSATLRVTGGPTQSGGMLGVVGSF